MIQLGDHFARDNNRRHSNWLRQQRWFIKAKQEQQRREDLTDEANDTLLTVATVVTMATEAQISDFETKLDIYNARLDAYEAKLDANDVAVTRALLENQSHLDKLLSVRDQLLANAFMLDDGRRVFKSEDGVSVIDEFGRQLSVDEVDPASIPNSFTAYESFAKNEELITILEAEREALHRAQAEIDKRRETLGQTRDAISDARDRLDDDGLSANELDELDAEILAAMPSDDLPNLPARAAKLLADEGKLDQAPNLQSSFTAPTAGTDSIRTVNQVQSILARELVEPGG